jgi:hypothetical protein
VDKSITRSQLAELLEQLVLATVLGGVAHGTFVGEDVPAASGATWTVPNRRMRPSS